MLKSLNEVLRFGLESGGDQSVWPLVIATALTAVMILYRQQDH